MRRIGWLGALLTIVALRPTASAPQSEFEKVLAFEASQQGNSPFGWGGGPSGTIFLDSEIVHGGDWSVRIERKAESQGGFTALTKSIPVDFQGRALELRGYMRTESVTEWAGLWLREDGEAGQVAFDNMQDRALRGTTQWTEYRITLPLAESASSVVFGALLAGEGKVWVDDLQLLVDGKPVSEAPKVERIETALDRDREFDQGSGIEGGTLTPEQIVNLATLGRVWGFLKYHHPAVTAPQLHWDYELFRVLPRILGAPDRSSANAVLLEWARALGELEECDPCAESPKEFHLLPDLNWIHQRDALGKGLSAYLENVYRNRDADGEQFFVSLHPGVGNPVFTREKGYRESRQPDAGFRLLALFRFWNIIQYWFPYRDLIEEDWHAVLAEFIPRLFAAGDPDAYRLELIALIARVRDGHANLWGSLEVRPPRGKCRLPVRLRFVQDKAVVVGYTHPSEGPASGLKIGDVITGLDRKTVGSLLEAWSPYYAASNQTMRLRDIARSMTVGQCGASRVQGERSSGPFELAAKRIPADDLDLRSGGTHDLPGAAFRLLSKEVAYLKLSSVKAAEVPEYIRRAQGTRGLIIDIRNYPSEFVVFALGRRLMKEPTPFARFTHGDLSNPGAFLWTQPLSLTPLEPGYEGKVVILVDELSLSQSEYTAMAFRSAPGALVVGSTTAGADGNVSPIPLPGALRTMISGIGVFYPDKSATQQVGIIPDVEVRPTIRGIRQGRDEVLEEALRQILGGAVSEESIRRMARGEPG